MISGTAQQNFLGRRIPVSAGRSVAALLAALAVIASTLVATPRSADAVSPVELFDTAWDLSFWAELNDVAVYFDHLERSGYTGVWLSLMNHTTGAGIGGVSPITETSQATFTNGEFDLDPIYRTHMATILDLADARGLRVGLLPMWGVGYLHDSSNGSCAGVNQGDLQATNSFEWGEEVATAFGSHPAIEYWILGGDNFCTPVEDGAIWSNMAAGIRSTGANQQMSYHSAGWGARQRLFADEPWVDFLSPQTGHCIPAADAQQSLSALVAEFDKPVIAAEMRYETIEPGWTCPEHGPGDPVLPSDVLDDAQAAVNAGVSGLLYGHNARWSWGRGQNGTPNLGWTGVQNSLNAPGELLVLDLLGLSGPPTTIAPTNVLEVIARGKDGTETITVEVAGQTVQSHTLTTALTTYTWTSPTAINASDVRILFTNDNGTARDAYIDAITINGNRHETEDPTTQSKGTWSGTDCGTGYRTSQWLHCNGWVHYDQTSTPPPTITPTTIAPSNPVVEVIARGKDGSEIIELEVAGQVVKTQTLTQSLAAYTWTSPIAVSASDIRVLFTNDNGTARDAYIDAITIDGVRYETEAASTESKGTWSGGNCGQGFKTSPWLHCNGWVHYEQ